MGDRSNKPVRPDRLATIRAGNGRVVDPEFGQRVPRGGSPKCKDSAPLLDRTWPKSRLLDRMQRRRDGVQRSNGPNPNPNRTRQSASQVLRRNLPRRAPNAHHLRTSLQY